MRKHLFTIALFASTALVLAQTTFTLDVVAEGNFGSTNGDVFRRNTTVSPPTTSAGVYQAANSTSGFNVLQDFVTNGNVAILAEKPSGSGKVVIASYPSLVETHTFTTSNAPQTLQFASPTKAYVGMANPGSMYWINITTNTMTEVSDPLNKITSTPKNMVYANGIMYATLGSSIVKVDTSTNAVLGKFSLPIGTIKGLQYESTSNKLWAMNSSGSIVSVDIASGDAIGTVIATGISSTKLLRSYGGKLYFWTTSKKLYIYNVVTPSTLPLSIS